MINLSSCLQKQDPSNQTKSRLRVLVADDHPVVREGMVAAISRQSDMYVTAVAKDGREAVTKAISEAPDVCLLDVNACR